MRRIRKHFETRKPFNYSTDLRAITEAMLNMIGHLEINQTPYLPKNGLIQITDSLFNLAKKQGVQFHFNERAEKTLEQEKSSSAIVFYWGIKGSFPKLTLHNIFFSDDYKAEFDGVFDKKTAVDNPTVYVNITSKYVKDDAPEGCENWFTMINSPVDVGQDWDKEIARIREKIIAKLSKSLGVDISELIEVEEVLDPQKIQSRYHG